MEGDVDLRGTQFSKALILHKLTIGRSLLLTGAFLGADDGQALNAEGLSVDQLRLELKSRPEGHIDFTEAKIGILSDTELSWPADKRLHIDGFDYRELGSVLSLKQRLLWLEQATPTYSPQPYEQLAKFYDAAGRLDEAKRVRREALRRSYDSRGILFKLFGRIQDLVLGFGYLPTRAAIIFLALWLTSTAWYRWGAGPCTRFGITWQSICPVQAANHLSWNPLLYSLDLLVPVIDLGYGKAWDPAGVSKLISFVLVVFGWVLTTTILASVARALRRS